MFEINSTIVNHFDAEAVPSSDDIEVAQAPELELA
jgi:hypothetical protein